MWEIGEQLVCIDDSNYSPNLFKLNCVIPKKGNIYTYDGECLYKKLGIYIQEVNESVPVFPYHRISFHQRRFVKISDYLISGGVLKKEEEKEKKINLKELV